MSDELDDHRQDRHEHDPDRDQREVSFTTGTLPNSNPAPMHRPTHATAPMRL